MADKWQEYGLDITGITKVVDPVLSTLDKGITALDTAITFLTKILKILQLYISAFSSFSSLMATFVTYGKKAISGYAKDLVSTGVYFNIFVPPAYQPDQISNVKYTKLASGGFNEFIQTLKVSLNSTADVNTPKFSDQAAVGGFIIMVDAETPDAFFRGVQFLVDNLGFTDIIPINTKTLPPIGIKSSAGYFTQSDGISQKFGIKLEWNSPPVRNFTQYRISRSQVSGGGEIETTHPVPNKLFGPKGHPEEGLFYSTWQRLRTGYWPEVITKSYLDPDFNDGKPVVQTVNPVGNWSGSYIDYDVNPSENRKYYYVLQSGFSLINNWSPYSSEIGVPTFPKNCVSQNMVGAAMHENGEVHLISIGEKLGQWSAVRPLLLIPYVPVLIEMLNTFLNSLEGSLKTNSKGFVDFIKGIERKFKTFKSYIQTLADMIVALENIFTGLPEIGILNLPPKAGGTTNFINRILKATPPPGGFTGPEGVTMGIVFVYGNYRVDVDAFGEKVEDMDAQVNALSKTFASIEKLLT
jgi:hypothetical protein